MNLEQNIIPSQSTTFINDHYKQRGSTCSVGFRFQAPPLLCYLRIVGCILLLTVIVWDWSMNPELFNFIKLVPYTIYTGRWIYRVYIKSNRYSMRQYSSRLDLASPSAQLQIARTLTTWPTPYQVSPITSGCSRICSIHRSIEVPFLRMAVRMAHIFEYNIYFGIFVPSIPCTFLNPLSLFCII